MIRDEQRMEKYRFEFAGKLRGKKETHWIW
jgi:hypothetical protein